MVFHCSYSAADAQRHRKMIEKDEHSNYQAKKIHTANLQAVINYCENVSDCRRVIQLQYFGEVFDSRYTSYRPAARNCVV